MSMILRICFSVGVVCVSLLLMVCVWKALWDWCGLDMVFSCWADAVRERRKTRKEMRFVKSQIKAIGYKMVEDEPYLIGLSGTFWCYNELEKPTLRRGTLKGVYRNSWICDGFPAFEILEEGFNYGREYAFGVKWDNDEDKTTIASDD